MLNETLAALAPGDTLLIPNKTYTLMGGIQATGLDSVVIKLDGTLSFSDAISEWPRDASGSVLECFRLTDPVNVTLTSSGKGTLDGQGARWWGFPGIGYLVRGENRPRLVKLNGAKDMLVENLLFLNSPYWTFTADGNDGLEVPRRRAAIIARGISRQRTVDRRGGVSTACEARARVR